ncbi:hypothetical protein NN439_001737, partial [Campylobacter coli]|nr:hypothetical protein [Campylobacter coli]
LEDFNTFLSENTGSDIYINTPLGDLCPRWFKNISYEEYRHEMSLIWKKLEFNVKIEQIMENAKKQANERIGNNFIAIHIRSGDAIYDYGDFRKFNLQSVYHATPCEIPLAIIEKNLNRKILLSGDDLETIQKIAEVSGHPEIYTMDDFRDVKTMSNLELFFFDIAFMSKALRLYGTHSAVVRLANFIGDQQFVNNYEEIDASQYLDIHNKYYPILNVSPSQKAFSLFHAFLYSKVLGKPIEYSISVLEDALKYDPDNDKYHIHIVDSLLSNNKKKEAEEYLCKVFFELNRKEQYIKTLLLRGWIGIVYKKEFQNYLKFAEKDFPCICYVASMITEFEGNIIRSHGFAILASNSKYKTFFYDSCLRIEEKVRLYYEKQNLERKKENALLFRNKALIFKSEWKWNKAVFSYQSSLEYTDDYLLEFLAFLVDIGKINLLNDIIEKYSYERLKSISELDKFSSVKDYLIFYDKYILNNSKMYYFLRDHNNSQSAILDFLSNHKDIDSIDENNELVITYLLMILIKKYKLKNIEFDIVKFYRKIWNKNLVRAQYIISKVHFIQWNNVDIIIGILSDLTALGDMNNRKILNIRKKIFNQLLIYTRKSNAKIAVCLWGIFRGNSDKTLKLIKENIIKPLNADVFLHLWDHWDVWNGYGGDLHWVRRYIERRNRKFFPKEICNYDTLKKYFPNVFRKISTPIKDDLPLDNIYSLLNPRKILIESQDDFINSVTIPMRYLEYSPFPNYAPYSRARLRYGMYKSFSLTKEVEQKYDYIILARVDQAYLDKFDQEQLFSLKDNDLLCRFLRHGLDDRIIAAKNSVIEKFVDKYSFMIERKKVDFYDSIKNSFHLKGEEGVGVLWCLENNISPININMNIDIYLPSKGMIPDFYNELITDLKTSGLCFSNKEEYINFVKFVKQNQQNLFKKYLNVGAVDRVKKHLSYRLGEIVLNNYNSFGKCIFIPFLLYIESNKFKKQNSKKLNRNKPLKYYDDYEQALVEQNSIAYKIGNIIVNANKRGKMGYFRVFCEIINIIKNKG